jgi:hypothetical protein
MDVAARARDTLNRIANAALATVAPNGSPWNSPVYVAHDASVFYWSSHVDAVHSRNIAVNPCVFLVIFDSTAPDATGHGVYVRAQAKALVDARSIDVALQILARRKQTRPESAADFISPHRRRVYEAVADAAWTNVVHEHEGRIFDERVTLDLTGPWPA